MIMKLDRTAVPIPYEALAAFCERHHVRRLWLYGSVLGPDFHPESDIDLLVEFEPGHAPGWEFYGDWSEELQNILGFSVDLGTPDSLRPWVRPGIMASARVVYERSE